MGTAGETTDAAAPDARRRELYALLGDLPPRHRPVAAEVIAQEEREDYLLDVLRLDLNGVEPVPAYYTRPLGRPGPFPVVVYNHAHGGDYVRGKDELLLGHSALQHPSYAVALARRGCAALCIDQWNFGERRGPQRVRAVQRASVARTGAVGVDGLRHPQGHRLSAHPAGDRSPADRHRSACLWAAPWPGGTPLSIRASPSASTSAA